jgi:Sulfatase
MTDAPKAAGERASPKSQTGPPSRRNVLLAGTAIAAAAFSAPPLVEQAQAQQPAPAPAAGSKPNIVVIMGDDIGWFNIGAYHQGIMAGKTPNLDKLAAEGMRFTDYYAEASCTAGRANFITGELPIRTGLTTVGQAGSPIGMPNTWLTFSLSPKTPEPPPAATPTYHK